MPQDEYAHFFRLAFFNDGNGIASPMKFCCGAYPSEILKEKVILQLPEVKLYRLLAFDVCTKDRHPP